MSLSNELAATLDDLGITHRQLDHWLTQGYIPAANPNPGSGNWRTLTPTPEAAA